MNIERENVKRKYGRWTDEQIIEVVSEYKTIKDLRMSQDESFYYLCISRGLREHLPPKYNEWTDEEIIEVISKYETISDLRMSEDRSFYSLCLRRDLREYLPLKRTRSNNIVGTSLERKNKSREPRKLVKGGSKHKWTDEQIIEVISKYETIKDLRISGDGSFYYLCLSRDLRQHLPPKTNRVKKENDKMTKSKQLYKHTFIEGVKICGRCFTLQPKTPRSILCKDCQKIYARKNAYDVEHVPYNLKQEYCNTTINHYEKTFELGIKVDEKLQNYLTLVGYGFIFKDPDENMWK